METQNKYYHPSIEELYFGFECERNNISENEFHAGLCNWEPCIIDHQNLIQLGVYSEWRLQGRFRVKYLDREDIESLGFIHKEDRGMSENYGSIYIKKDPRFEKANITIRYWVTTGAYRLRIEIINGCIFDGNIKNKSELKKLLEWLKIQA